LAKNVLNETLQKHVLTYVGKVLASKGEKKLHEVKG
jgi:hypothetical protein